MKYKLRAALLLPVLLFLPAACKKSHPPPAEDQTSAAVYTGVGVVQGVERELKTIQIDHEEIKDFMPAMNMPYKVDSELLLDAIQPGDRIEFSLQASSAGMKIIEIKKRT